MNDLLEFMVEDRSQRQEERKELMRELQAMHQEEQIVMRDFKLHHAHC